VEGQGFQALIKEYAQHNIAVVGVSNDDTAANKAFADANGFEFPLLCDTDLSISIAFGAAEPGATSCRRNAVLISADGRIEQYWSNVDARSFPQDLVTEMRRAKRAAKK